MPKQINQKLAIVPSSEEKTESLSTMATGIAHDFNNLLAAILGNVSIIMRGIPADSPLRKNALQIETTAQRAVELTNLLQAYAGKGTFRIGMIDLNSVITDTLPALKVCVNTGITIECSLSDNLPMIKGDNEKIALAVSSLIHNASDAILGNTGTITIATGTMQSDQVRRDEACLDEISVGNDFVFVEVTDTGCGMTPGVQGKIFDPFFTTKIRGQGLSLSVVLGIMRAHGGGVAVSSTPGKGTSFQLLFPAVKD